MKLGDVEGGFEMIWLLYFRVDSGVKIVLFSGGKKDKVGGGSSD